MTSAPDHTPPNIICPSRPPAASILIVTYNSSTTIRDCLLSLDYQTYRDFDVVVVDNRSADRTRAAIECCAVSYPLKTFFLSGNMGFAGGNRYALGHASGRYIGLLNPDAMPEPNWLAEMVDTLDARPDVGICASRLIADATDTVDSAGDGYSSFLKGFKRGEGQSKDMFDKPEYVFGACAGAALYRKAMLDQIGFFDEAFFLLHEDTDLNFRAQLAGWKVFYVPSATVRHHVSSSIGYMSDIAIYYSLRNIELVRIKNIPAILLLRHALLLIAYAIAEFYYFAVRHKKVRLYFSAKMAVLGMMPQMMRKRISVYRTRTLTAKELIATFTPATDNVFIGSKTRRLLTG